MTDYNDGRIHGWNGGECPVHLQSIVDVWDSEGWGQGLQARNVKWLASDASRIAAFRVVRAYREPREWWLRINALGHECGSDPVCGPPPPNWSLSEVIKVREVLE